MDTIVTFTVPAPYTALTAVVAVLAVLALLLVVAREGQC